MPESRPQICFLYVPCADQKSAGEMARTVISEGLAACGNIFSNIISVYHWQGKLEESPEVVMILKTTQDHVPRLESRLRDLHSYTTPCFARLSVDHINRDYAQWLLSNL